MFKKTRILIVDDSPTARVALHLALEFDAGLAVVGEASNAEQALRLARELDPDIVTMDVYLRHQNGLDVTAMLMEKAPCPILIITAVNPTDPSLVYRAVEVGALDVCGKLPGYDDQHYGQARSQLVDLVKRLAKVPVVRRRAGAIRSERPTKEAKRPDARLPGAPRLIAIGASTGGPPIVCDLLKNLPREAPVPILVAQHMASGFMRGFAEWLAADSRLPVHLVERPEQARPGHVYLAADDHHLTVVSSNSLAPSDAPPHHHHRPSIDIMLEGVARHYGPAAVGILLTGMGSDGANGLLGLRRAGGFTIAQEPKSCAVSSMPERAIALGATELVLPPYAISETITRALGRSA